MDRSRDEGTEHANGRRRPQSPRAYRPRILKLEGVTYHLEHWGRRGIRVYRQTPRGLRKGTIQDVARVEAALRRENRERAERHQAVEALAAPEPPEAPDA